MSRPGTPDTDYPETPEGALMPMQEFRDSQAVHRWFELTYAQYLTVPRSIMEAMPGEWQQRMVKCLEELGETFDWTPKTGRYWVQLKDGEGKYTEDPLMQYRRPNFNYIESIRKKNDLSNNP